jgi:hypothetical protein
VTEKGDQARKRADSHFTASEKRDQSVRQQIQSERTAVDARTEKLRAATCEGRRRPTRRGGCTETREGGEGPAPLRRLN